jgi:hypothetical protein
VSPPVDTAIETTTTHSDPEVRAVGDVLAKYQQVYNRLDASGAAAIWPGVDTKALSRSFAQLERQNMSFDDCSIVIIEGSAKAHCPGLLEYVPRVGNNRIRSERHSWTIELRRDDESWRILKVSAR